MPDFIPSTDSGKRSWGLNFKTLISPGPSYGLTALQATAFGAAFDAFDAALTTATEPSTRTPSAIVAKDDTRDSMVAMARELARIVQASPTVTDEDRTDLRLPIRDTNPSPQPTPAVVP